MPYIDWSKGPRRRSLDRAEEFRQRGEKGKWTKMTRIQIPLDVADPYTAKKRAKDPIDESEDTTLSEAAASDKKPGYIDAEVVEDAAETPLLPEGTGEAVRAVVGLTPQNATEGTLGKEAWETVTGLYKKGFDQSTAVQLYQYFVPEEIRQNIQQGALTGLVKTVEAGTAVWDDLKTIDESEKYSAAAYITSATAHTAEFALKKYDQAFDYISKKTGIYRPWLDVAEMFIPYGAVMKASKLKHVGKLDDVVKQLDNAYDVFNRYGRYVQPNITPQVFASQQGYAFLDMFDETGTVAKLYKQLDDLPAGQFIGDQKTFIKKSGEKIPILAKPRTEAKRVQSLIGQAEKILGNQRPKWYNPKTYSTWVFESKGKGKWSAIDYLKKKLRVNKRLNLSKGKYISLEEFVEELGPELGAKAFHLNENKLEKLYRWVSKEGANLDHILPISGKKGGYLVHTNMLLQLVEINIKKGNKILPTQLLKDMGVPLTKAEAIRSVLKPQKMTNKQKRIEIIKALGIVK